MNNYRRNKAEIDKFRKELMEMLDDVSEIDKTILDKAGNKGRSEAVKLNEHAKDTGFMQKSWRVSRTTKVNGGIQKELFNTADYASYVNDGHRIVNKNGETVGFVKGHFILEKALSKADNVLKEEFEKEVERVRKKHDK